MLHLPVTASQLIHSIFAVQDTANPAEVNLAAQIYQNTCNLQLEPSDVKQTCRIAPKAWIETMQTLSAARCIESTCWKRYLYITNALLADPFHFSQALWYKQQGQGKIRIKVRGKVGFIFRG